MQHCLSFHRRGDDNFNSTRHCVAPFVNETAPAHAFRETGFAQSLSTEVWVQGVPVSWCGLAWASKERYLGHSKRSEQWNAVMHGYLCAVDRRHACMWEWTSKARAMLYLVMSTSLMPTISSPECVSDWVETSCIVHDLVYLFRFAIWAKLGDWFLPL